MSPLKAIIAGCISTCGALGTPSIGGHFYWWQIPAAITVGLTTFSGVYFVTEPVRT